MITSRIRRRRHLLDAFVHVEIEERELGSNDRSPSRGEEDDTESPPAIIMWPGSTTPDPDVHGDRIGA